MRERFKNALVENNPQDNGRDRCVGLQKGNKTTLQGNMIESRKAQAFVASGVRSTGSTSPRPEFTIHSPSFNWLSGWLAGWLAGWMGGPDAGVANHRPFALSLRRKFHSLFSFSLFLFPLVIVPPFESRALHYAALVWSDPFVPKPVAQVIHVCWGRNSELLLRALIAGGLADCEWHCCSRKEGEGKGLEPEFIGTPSVFGAISIPRYYWYARDMHPCQLVQNGPENI